MERVSFVTLTRTDPEFRHYLEGTFSNTHRALPVHSVNLNSDQERVTFRIIENEKLHRPPVWRWLLNLVRPEWLSLSIMPMLATAAYLWGGSEWAQQSFDRSGFVLALLSVMSLQMGVLLLNDYSDYVAGADRVRLKDERDHVKRGWVTARALYRGAVTFLVLGSALGLPLVLNQPFFLMLTAVAAGLAVLGYSFRNRGWKHLGLGDAAVWFCLGPLLTYGASRVAVHQHPWQIYVLGALFGHHAMMALQARQLTNIMQDAQMGARTLAVRLGFDRARRHLQVQLAIAGILVVVACWVLTLPAWTVLLLLPYAWGSGRVFSHLQYSPSPLSTPLQDLHRQVAHLHLYLGLALILGWVGEAVIR